LANRQRVLDVGVARAPDLAVVGGPGDLVGVHDQRRVGPRMGAAVHREEGRQLVVDVGIRRPPWRYRRTPPPQNLVDRRHYSYTNSETRSLDSSLSRPCRKASSMTKPRPRTVAPRRSTRWTVADAVPPVASTSSTISTFS